MKTINFLAFTLSALAFAAPLHAQQSIPERAQMTPLQTAIFNKNLTEVSRLLSAGANPAEQDGDGETALHLAAAMEDPRYLRALFEAGADPNMASSSGDNALHAAIVALHPEHLRLLLDAGANPNQADIVGKTPLHAAGAMHQTDMILLLLERGADPQARDKSGFTFQKHLHPDPYVPRNAKGKEGIKRVVQWLQARGLAVDAELLSN